jgi:hypothetical protein
MIQITPQMRTMVAVESVDFRKGIGSLHFRVTRSCSAAGEQLR